MCDFKPVEGKILKTVDSVYQDVKTPKECEQRCLSGAYKCHSYDFGDPANPVCRTSHLDKVALTHIENPYIEIAGATTFELQNCYDGNLLICVFVVICLIISPRQYRFIVVPRTW